MIHPLELKEDNPHMGKNLFRAAIICAFVLRFATSLAAVENSFTPDTGGYNLRLNNCRARIDAGGLSYYQGLSNEPALRCSLKSISLGGIKVIPASASKLTAQHNVIRRCFDAGFSESYTARPDGVEQCWIIDSRPSSGGIVVESDLHCDCKPVLRGDEWEFLDNRGRPILRYGAATVIDNKGKTFHCMPVIRNSKLTISVPASFIGSAEFPIVVDPVVGPAIPMCPTFDPAPNNQMGIQIAASPYGYLAVWQDTRGGTSDIFGCRLDSSGNVLDMAGIGYKHGNQRPGRPRGRLGRAVLSGSLVRPPY